ncbi:hypothetical protein HDU98_002828, partial [Podochytrium sp. JEL0797]
MFSIALLLAGLASQALADCTQINNVFILDPPTLNCQSSQFGASFTIALANKPNGTVQAAFKLDGMQFDTTMVTFTTDNWATPQQVVVVPNTAATASNTVSLKMAIDVNAPCLSYHQCTADYYVNHDTQKPLTCTASGDPHFSTINGADEDFHAAGGFYYYKSDTLMVQGYQYPCLPGQQVMCLGAVSVRYGDSVVLLDGLAPGDQSILDVAWSSTKQKAAKLTLVSPTMVGMDYEPKNVADSPTFKFTTDD